MRSYDPMISPLLWTTMVTGVGPDVHGVGMPGHFLVGSAEGKWYDPFYGGVELDVDGCAARYAQTHDAASFSTELLAPVGEQVLGGRSRPRQQRLHGQRLAGSGLEVGDLAAPGEGENGGKQQEAHALHRPRLAAPPRLR